MPVFSSSRYSAAAYLYSKQHNHLTSVTQGQPEQHGKHLVSLLKKKERKKISVNQEDAEEKTSVHLTTTFSPKHVFIAPFNNKVPRPGL